MVSRVCGIEGCGGKYNALGVCKKHYDALPKSKAAKKARDASPERQAILRDRQRSPHYKAVKKINRARPEFRAAKRARENTPQYKAQKNRYQMGRRQSDPFYRFKYNVRVLLAESFSDKGFRKDSRTAHLLGCSFEEAIISIGWFPGCEIHHIVPIHTANTKEDVERLSHHTNLIALSPKEHDALHADRFELIPRKSNICP